MEIDKNMEIMIENAVFENFGEAIELSEDELLNVQGGSLVAASTGAFTTQREAQVYAAQLFNTGAVYTLKQGGRRVVCEAFGAKYFQGYWFAAFFYKEGNTFKWTTKNNIVGF